MENKVRRRGMRSKELLRGMRLHEHGTRRSTVAEEGRWQWLIDRRDGQGKRPEDVDFDPRTLYIPDQGLRGMTKFVSQFWSIKKNNFDVVLFVRWAHGDGDSKGEYVEGGCRASSFDFWCMKALSLGHAVGRVEEIHGAEGHGTILQRELVQVYTPGTCRIACWNFDADSQVQDGEGTAMLLALCESGSATDGLVGACLLDIDTATLRIAQWHEVDYEKTILSRVLSDTNPTEIVCRSRLSEETRRVLARYRPLVAEGIDSKASIRFLRVDSDSVCPQGPGFDDSVHDRDSETGGDIFRCGLCMDTKIGRGVMRRARVEKMIHFSPSGAAINGTMMLDGTALKTLEILQGSLGTAKGSLYEFLASETQTVMGKRCIWKWLLAPLFRHADIQERLLVVDTFRKIDVEPLLEALKCLPDVEKMMPVVAQQLFSA
eukprot:jgi/Picre1/30290/NNA_005654.t1